MEWDQKEKNYIRQEVCKGGKEPYTSVLLLPSATCLDINQMLKTGAIDTHTRVVAVERDKLLSSVIAEKLQKSGFSNFQVHNSELSKTDLGNEQFDFVYLDTCGDLNPALVKWLAEQVQRGVFKKATRIAMAFSHDRFRPQVDRKFKTFARKNKVSLPKTDPEVVNIAKLATHADIHTTKATILSLMLGEVEKSYIYKNGAKGTPMHVFIFKPRKINNGLTTVMRFLGTLGVEVEAITPGVKAAIARRKDTKKSTKPTKPTRVWRGKKREDIDKNQVEIVMSKHSLSEAARILDLPFATLHDFIKRHNIPTPMLGKGNKGGRKPRKVNVELTFTQSNTTLKDIRDQVRGLLDKLNSMLGEEKPSTSVEF